jgi:hypothetical protein
LDSSLWNEAVACVPTLKVGNPPLIDGLLLSLFVVSLQEKISYFFFASRCSVVSLSVVITCFYPQLYIMGVQATWRAHPRKFGPDSRAWLD